MKSKYLILCVVGLAACVENRHNEYGGSQSTGGRDSIDAATMMPEQNRRYCFVRTEGSENQDTTKVYFVVSNHTVSGQMEWLPKEKDSRIGDLTGVLSGGKMTAVWHYMQEGQRDSMKLDFMLTAEQLTQKPLKTNMNTGRQETDVAADYSVVYVADDCL